jgi:hypothetical protein
MQDNFNLVMDIILQMENAEEGGNLFIQGLLYAPVTCAADRDQGSC